MSISSVSIIMKRIQGAEHNSRIAVFRKKINGKWRLNAVFANTVHAEARIRDGDPSLIGVYYMGNNVQITADTLTRALGVS